MTTRFTGSDIRVRVEPEADPNRTAVVAVGDTGTWRARGRALPIDGSVTFADIHEITATFLEVNGPQLILSPLLARNFDCLDLAMLLDVLSFRGRYRVIEDKLPDPTLVIREVAALAPTLDFGVLSRTSVTG